MGAINSPGGGGGSAEFPPVAANFTWVNQGTSTATDGDNGLVIVPQNGASLRGLLQASPAATFTVDVTADQVWKTASGTGSDASYFGPIVQSTDANKMAGYCFGVNNGTSGQFVFRRLQWDSAGALASAGTVFTLPSSIRFIRTEVTATLLIGSVSTDGRNWIPLESVTLASYLTSGGGTIDNVGLGAHIIGTSIVAAITINNFAVA